MEYSKAISAQGRDSLGADELRRIDVALGFEMEGIDVPGVPGGGLVFVELERVARSGEGFAVGRFFDEGEKLAGG